MSEIFTTDSYYEEFCDDYYDTVDSEFDSWFSELFSKRIEEEPSLLEESSFNNCDADE